MKKYLILATAILTTLMMVSMFHMGTPVKAAARTDLDLVWFTDADATFTALQAGTVDLMQWALTKEQKVAVEADPNLQLAAYSENGFWELDFNNNYTIDDFPHSTNPMWFEKVRQAFAFAFDKTYIIHNVLEDFGSEIDAPVCFPQTEGWVNASMVNYDYNHNGVIDPSEANYPYKYNIETAAKYLADMGFSDTDHNGYLNYPTDSAWGAASGIDTTLMPIIICSRVDDPNRLAAGQYMWGQLEGDPALAGDSVLAHAAYWAAHGKVGGDFDTTDHLWEKTRAILKPKVMAQMDYHIYTGGWSMGRFPTYVYSLYYSGFWYPSGSNYITGEGPNSKVSHSPAVWAHPALDPLAKAIYYTASIATAQVACQKATGYIIQHCVNLPIWSFTSYTTWRKEMAAVVNEKGVGIINDFTFLNAFRGTNPTIRVGIANSWDKLNHMYSQWYFEYTLLDRTTSGLISANPYDLAQDLPWVAQDWSDAFWTDPRDGGNKSVVTYYLRQDAGIVEPVTGKIVGTFGSPEYVFTCWYNYPFDDDWQQSAFMDLHHLEVVNSYTVKAYFDDQSYWFKYAPTYPLFGPADLLTPKVCTKTSVTFTGASLYNPGEGGDPGYLEYQFASHKNVVSVINATKNGGAITEGVDFYIRGGYDSNPSWPNEHDIYVPITALAPGDTVTIWYWTQIPGGADGQYTMANAHSPAYTWTDTFYTVGTHYPVSISSTEAALNKNPAFFMDSPLLGEIDWRWYYTTTSKPRLGNYKVEILDVVKCTSAYSARGDGKYNSAYFPGADLDSSDLCHVGILDLVSITGKYAATFGAPPASYHWGRVASGTVTLTLPDLVGATSTSTVAKTTNAGNIVWNTGAGTASMTLSSGTQGWAEGYYTTSAGKIEKVFLQVYS